MSPAWKRLVVSILVLHLVLAYVVFSLANYVLWRQMYNENTGPLATKGLLDTVPGVRASVVFGVTLGGLVLFNAVPALLRSFRAGQPAGRSE
jgi:uncharacterized membrane protein